MKTTLKILVFVALLVLYLSFAGALGWHTLYGRKLLVIYEFGAVMALWFGGQRIGTLDQISLRPIFITLGVILMLTMFILMVETRDTARQLFEIHGRAPNKSPEPTAVGACSSAVAIHVASRRWLFFRQARQLELKILWLNLHFPVHSAEKASNATRVTRVRKSIARIANKSSPSRQPPCPMRHQTGRQSRLKNPPCETFWQLRRQ